MARLATPSSARLLGMAPPQVLAFGLLLAAATATVVIAEKGAEQNCGVGPRRMGRRLGKGRAAAVSRLETGRRPGGGGKAPTLSGGREHPRLVALHSSLGKWPEVGAEGQTRDGVATYRDSSASECATRSGAHLGIWSGRNQLGPGRESATSA